MTLYKKGNFLISKLLYFTETSHPNFILNLVKFFNKMMWKVRRILKNVSTGVYCYVTTKRISKDNVWRNPSIFVLSNKLFSNFQQEQTFKIDSVKRFIFDSDWFIFICSAILHLLMWIIRSSHLELFCKKGVRKHFAKLTEKHLKK